jgi:uncharacterized membrane protein
MTSATTGTHTGGESTTGRSPANGPAAVARIESVDALRGIAMVLMALDHTRDFFGLPGDNPTNVARAGAALFFTRWITHICAPAFFLLTGVGAGLAGASRSRADLSRFLVVRGAMLVLLELVVLRALAYQFNLDYRVTMLLVIWALGWSMMVLGVLVHLPTWAVAAFGVVLVGGHNALDGIRSAHPLWVILHGPGVVAQGKGWIVFASYPLVPWIGVTALGYALARVFTWPPARRRAFVLRVGIGAVFGFVALRVLNAYGDPVRWSAQAGGVRTALAFLNATKYPPSLVFLLMTLGPALLILRALERRTPRWLEPTLAYGRAPLFYYATHFFLIHALAVVVCFARYGTAHWMFESPDLANYPFTAPPEWGYPLPVVYLLWISVVVALFPACRRVAVIKATRRHRWLSYF